LYFKDDEYWADELEEMLGTWNEVREKVRDMIRQQNADITE
jgi:hypothetical protein